MVRKGGVMHYIVYVERSENKIIHFSYEKTMKAWTLDFLMEYQDDPDSWIEYIFNGDLTYNRSSIINTPAEEEV